MFRLSNAKQFWYPVSVGPLYDETGREKKFTFDAQFERLEQTELLEFLESGGATGRAPKDSEICERVFKAWRKVQDEDGNDLPVTAENRKRLLEAHPVTPSIVRAWLEAVGLKGREGN